MPDDDAFDELCYYTLAHGSPAFLHQHVVDAFAAQQAHAATKPIKLTFALVGLYLHLERQFTGKQVQRVHMLLAGRTRAWPVFPLPATRGSVTAAHVLAAPEGPARDEAIDVWCAAVWDAYRESHQRVAQLLKEHDIT